MTKGAFFIDSKYRVGIVDAKNATQINTKTDNIHIKRLDIEKRRTDDLSNITYGSVERHISVGYELYEKETSKLIKDVNAKYDAELKDLELSKPENLVTSNQSIESSLDVKDKSTELIKEDEELVRSLGLNSKTKETDEDYDIAISDESEFVDNSNVGISTAPTVDLQSDYINFFMNDLNREQQSILREQVSNGNIQVKCE